MRLRGVVAVAVGAPDRILISAGSLPGNVIAACRLHRADRRPAAKLARRNIRTVIFQRRAGSIVLKINNSFPTSVRLVDPSVRITVVATDRSVAVQVLVETGSNDSSAALFPDTAPMRFAV